MTDRALADREALRKCAVGHPFVNGGSALAGFLHRPIQAQKAFRHSQVLCKAASVKSEAMQGRSQMLDRLTNRHRPRYRVAYLSVANARSINLARPESDAHSSPPNLATAF